MNHNHPRTVRKVKQALVMAALAVTALGPATPALGAAHARDHARRTRITHAHARSQAHFRTDGRKVG